MMMPIATMSSSGGDENECDGGLTATHEAMQSHDYSAAVAPRSSMCGFPSPTSPASEPSRIIGKSASGTCAEVLIEQEHAEQ